MPITGLWTRIQSGVIGLAVGGSLSRAFEPMFEGLRQRAWHGNANRVLSPREAAELVARAIVEFSPAAEEARRSGLDGNRLRALVELTLTTPTIGAAMDARRRNAITPEQFTHVLNKAGIEPQYHDAMRALLNVLPSVTDLVRMAVREVFNPAQRAALDLDAEFPGAFADAAERVGLSRSTAGNYWAAHWELPSYEQLAQMRFRGLLSPEEFRNALKAIDFAPVWRAKLEEIARRIPTMQDMVRFAVREVYNPAVRRGLGIDAEYPDAFTPQAALHGLTEEHARQYWAAHWRLPSARQGYQMLWRREINEAELDLLLKALDYPPLWRQRLANIARIVPGRIDLKRMLRHEIKTRAEVKAGYQRIGYAEADAEFMTQIAEAEVGSGEAASTWLGRARSRVYTVAHNEYLDGSIGEARARSDLRAVGAPAAELGRIIGLWNREREISRLELTPAQIRKAYKKGLPGYSEPEALAELEERGMTPEDALTFLASG